MSFSMTCIFRSFGLVQLRMFLTCLGVEYGVPSWAAAWSATNWLLLHWLLPVWYSFE
jgi:hypothetical protein